MSAYLPPLAGGLLFGLGLSISGMLDPARVRGLLDVGGAWDPSLAFVLGGALAVSGAGYALARRHASPAFAPAFDLPRMRIDPPLIGGAALFGVGWGLSGFCPGPAVAALSTDDPGPRLRRRHARGHGAPRVSWPQNLGARGFGGRARGGPSNPRAPSGL